MSAETPSTYLYLIRHGATVANEQRPYVLQGRGIDLPLSPTGRRQAEAVADFLAEFPLSAVYSSTMRRAAETAESIASRHGLLPTTVAHLQECDVGRWEGLDWETIMREHAESYHAFMNDPAENPYLGGESYGDVLRRIVPVFDELMQRHAGRSIAVVAHNVVNRVYVAHLLGLDLRRARDLQQKNTCINVIRQRGGETRLLTMNSCFHLNGLAVES